MDGINDSFRNIQSFAELAGTCDTDGNNQISKEELFAHLGELGINSNQLDDLIGDADVISEANYENFVAQLAEVKGKSAGLSGTKPSMGLDNVSYAESQAMLSAFKTELTDMGVKNPDRIISKIQKLADSNSQKLNVTLEVLKETLEQKKAEMLNELDSAEEKMIKQRKVIEIKTNLSKIDGQLTKHEKEVVDKLVKEVINEIGITAEPEMSLDGEVTGNSSAEPNEPQENISATPNGEHYDK